MAGVLPINCPVTGLLNCVAFISGLPSRSQVIYAVWPVLTVLVVSTVVRTRFDKTDLQPCRAECATLDDTNTRGGRACAEPPADASRPERLDFCQPLTPRLGAMRR